MNRNDLLIEADELAGMLDDPDLRLFDATVIFDPSQGSGIERYQDGHIPGAVFLDHGSLSVEVPGLMYTLPDETTLEQKIGDIGVGNDNPVVVYSADMIAWATRIWWVLTYAGHSNVRVLNGGISAWQGELETGSNEYAPATFKASYSPGMFATSDEVMDAIRSGDTCVINTLMPEMYSGEADVPYTGHISGSLNHSMLELSDGVSLLPDDVIRQKFADRDFGERLITYCGGGIAATLNACAAKLIGIEDVAVYDGSMTEWMKEGLPVTAGYEPGSID